MSDPAVETPAFVPGNWQREIDVRDFIQKNHTPYDGDGGFLAPATERTKEIWAKVLTLIEEERKKGVLDIDVKTPSNIASHGPGYIDKGNEVIVGLQTDAPLKRGIKPKGGIRLVKTACAAYGFTLDPETEKIFSEYRKTHNEGVFDLYQNWEEFHTPGGELLRKFGIITGLPDNYGRGRIIGDYRRVALYGIDRLIEAKKEDIKISYAEMNDENIRVREEVAEQIKALSAIKKMAAAYGFDLSKPATSFKEAVQFVYFGYLAAVKEQDGAAMSMGRIDAFLDIYAEHDLKNGVATESDLQEILDDFVIKLRIVRQLRAPEYNELFAGDPTWVTCLIGGQGIDGRTMVTKTTFRLLHSLYNLGPAPEPNITIAWSNDLPEGFKRFASEVAIDTCSIQFESDDLMRPRFGDDYAIACCVSAMRVGKDMQFFGARCNLAKLLLLAINAGKDEMSGKLIKADVPELNSKEVLDYEEVKELFFRLMRWLTKEYVGTMNIIHFMHDKYNYESSEMALHDTEVHRFMAFGIAGISVVADSLSAIKHARVTAIRDENGIAQSFTVEGDFPKYGNDDDRADSIAVEVTKEFYECLKAHKTYKNAEHTLSLLTITSNVVYGSHTGATPDGRAKGEAFAPGANPMHNRDSHGAISSLNSVAKIPYAYCQDGISNTFSITPAGLGKSEDERRDNLKGLMDGYFKKGGFHLNVNVFHRDTLLDAMEHPEKYPQLTIRVSGYAVQFNRLTRKQQEEVVHRTFHEHF